MPGNDEGRPPPGDEPAHIEALQPTEPPTNSDSTPEHRQNINYTAALELAARAWEVFPCWEYNYKIDPKTGEPEGAKAPRTAHGHHDASRDPDQIKAWWRRWPSAMIGAAVPDTLLVIDVDPRNGGDLEKLIALVGDLPPTLTVWSGRNDGGRHLYFLRPPGPLTSTQLPEGIDLKANGYCIVPPSIHPATGQPYRWEDHPVASLPYGLRELLRPAPQPVKTYRGGSSKATAGLVRTVANAAVGQRNRILFWASCRAAEKGLIDQIEDDLVAAALTNGLTETVARRTVASARRAAS